MGCQFSALRRAPHFSTASPPHPGISIEMHRRSGDTQTRRWTLMKQPSHSQCQLIPIDILPDDVLLEIFDFYMYPPDEGYKAETEVWQTLVHVCQRWRSLVFASPRRLDLQLYCTPYTPVKDRPDVWPALPLIIWGSVASLWGTDAVLAALRQSNRVRQVVLWDLVGWQIEQVLAAMQVPFPELTNVRLFSLNIETPQLIPDSFLNGSAPSLQSIQLYGIPFPGLSRLLLSSPHLVSLSLINIPHSEYISPETIVTLLSVLSSLKHLSLQFQSPQARPDWESRRPPHSIISALVSLRFKGVTEYLEDLVTFIDTPQLGIMDITFFDFFDQIDFDTPRLARFINRTFKLAKSDAHLQFDDYGVRLRLEPLAFQIEISCGGPAWQVSSIKQVCNSSSHLLSTVEDLYIEPGFMLRYTDSVWKGDLIENTLWLQLLLQFTAVKSLYLAKEFSQGIAAALKELVGGGITEVLPNLENIFLEGLDPLGSFPIGQFVAARRLSDHPITVSDWELGPKLLTET